MIIFRYKEYPFIMKDNNYKGKIIVRYKKKLNNNYNKDRKKGSILVAKHYILIKKNKRISN